MTSSIQEVAESVEDHQTAEILNALGVQHTPEYLFDKPTYK